MTPTAARLHQIIARERATMTSLAEQAWQEHQEAQEQRRRRLARIDQAQTAIAWIVILAGFVLLGVLLITAS